MCLLEHSVYNRETFKVIYSLYDPVWCNDIVSPYRENLKKINNVNFFADDTWRNLERESSLTSVHDVSGSNACWGWGFWGRTGRVAGRYIKIEPDRNAQMLQEFSSSLKILGARTAKRS